MNNSLSKSLKIASSLTLLGFLSGCSLLPNNEGLIQPNTLMNYQTKDSFKHQKNILWPKENWWTTYNDKQLNQLMKEALADSPNIVAAQARLNEASAFTKVVKSTQLPQVGLNAKATREKHSYNYLTSKAYTPQGWNAYGLTTLNFSWEIDFWGKHRETIAASISKVEALKAELAQTRLTLFAAIATSYAQIVGLYAQKDTLNEFVEIQNKLLSLLEQRFDNGLENKASLQSAKSTLTQTQSEILSFEEKIALEKNKIAALIGAGPDRALQIKKPSIDFYNSDFALPKQIKVDLIGRRPDIRAAKMLVEAQEHMVVEKKAEFYPNVNLSAFLGFQSLGLDLLTQNSSYIGSIGPSLSLPIFTAGRLQGQLNENISKYEQSVANYNQTITEALKEVADAGQSQKLLVKQIHKSQEAYNASQEAYDLQLKRYEGGLSNLISVLYTQEKLLSVKRSLINQKSRSLALDIALKYALGGGYNSQSAMIKKGNNNGRK